MMVVAGLWRAECSSMMVVTQTTRLKLFPSPKKKRVDQKCTSLTACVLKNWAPVQFEDQGSPFREASVVCVVLSVSVGSAMECQMTC